MSHLTCDVAILGAGFGGSLAALLLQRIGLRPLLIERGRHPRFAIGESSTPIADLLLRDFAREFNLPRLAPLGTWGSWRRTYPGVMRGLKRGFSYFLHQPGELFRPDPGHGNELLVAASFDDEHGDTHWVRADVDAFLVEEARREGVPYLDETLAHPSPAGSGWRISAERQQQRWTIDARFLIDAGGGAGTLARILELPNETDRLRTQSRAIYAHVTGLLPWHEVYRRLGGCEQDHPFRCDQAAVHHLLDEGWMFQLGFDHGVTSVGFVLDACDHPLQESLPVEEEWGRLLARYPSLAEQFAPARVVQPPEGFCRTGRMQRQVGRLAGGNWALLPSAAGFIDPLHSTGIAHTLCGLEHLVQLLRDHWLRDTLPEQLQVYSERVQTELMLIDRLVHGCYLSRREFDLFTGFSMLYFAAATSYEQRRLLQGERPAFLCADEPGLSSAILSLSDRLATRTRQAAFERAWTGEFTRDVFQQIEPFNSAGLGRPVRHNMYARTALPVDQVGGHSLQGASQ